MKLALLLIFLIGMTSFIKTNHVVEISSRKTKITKIKKLNKTKPSEPGKSCSLKDFDELLNELEELVKESESKSLDDATDKLKKTTSTTSKGDDWNIPLSTSKSKDDDWNVSSPKKSVKEITKKEIDDAWDFDKSPKEEESLENLFWPDEIEEQKMKKRWKIAEEKKVEKTKKKISKKEKASDEDEEQEIDPEELNEFIESQFSKDLDTIEKVKSFFIGLSNGIPIIQSCKDALINIIIQIMKTIGKEGKFTKELYKLTNDFQEKMEKTKDTLKKLENKAEEKKCFKRGMIKSAIFKSIGERIEKIWKKITKAVSNFEKQMTVDLEPLYTMFKKVAICIFKVVKLAKVSVGFLTFGLSSLPTIILSGIESAKALKEIYDWFQTKDKISIDYQKLGKQVGILINAALSLVNLKTKK